MPPKGQTRLESRTQLAFVRHRAGIPQIDMARRIGVSIATYQRLEEDRMPNPPLRYLVNAAIVLNVPLQALVEPKWMSWWDPDDDDPDVPDPRRARWK